MHFRILTLLLALSQAPQAFAAVHFSGSVSSSTSNGTLQALDYRSGSGSIAVDIFTRYLRLGITHKQAFTRSEGWTVVDGAPDGGTTTDVPLGAYVTEYESTSHAISNSIDLTWILFEGTTFMPYLLGGVVYKTTYSSISEAGKEPVSKVDKTPGPNVGAGLGIRLSKDFTLKLSYIISPGVSLLKFDETGHPKEQRTIWDREASVGLTYEL